MEDLLKYLNAVCPLSTGLTEYLGSILQVREIGKKQFLLKAGHVSRNICFIKRGMFRCFYSQNSIEVSSWFMKEGDVIISVESFFAQKESKESIQALEDGEVYCIDYLQLQHIYRNFPEFNFIGRVLTEHYYTLSEQRLYSLRMLRASERYLNLMENHSELIQRVPSKYIASYLGVTEETLSRIRSKRY
ncbi:MAG TPA: Crp/Fnr family transcriptional regulator [Segetibacter sp.]